MAMHVRKLPILAALVAVAPLSAHPTAASDLEGLQSDCPYARAAAEAEAARAGATTVTIETAVPEGSLLGGGEHPSAFLP